VVAAETSNNPLTDAEIAGIVCACLIFVVCLAIAAIYYWLCRKSPAVSANKVGEFFLYLMNEAVQRRLLWDKPKNELIPLHKKLFRPVNKFHSLRL